MSKKEIQRYLNVIKRATSLIEGMLENDDGGLLESLVDQTVHHVPQPIVHPPVVHPPVVHATVPVVAPQPVPQVDAAEQLAFAMARKKHVQDLLAIDCWPEAVPQYLVARDASEEDQANRAKAVLDMMLDRRIENLNFLDFGCGDGWIAQEAMNRGAAESTGYDIKVSEQWAKLKGSTYTNVFGYLKPNHYDVIVLYDVLDHCEDAISVVGQVRSLLKEDGVVYVRCHPWTSKHASHLYKQGVNKAYIHLFLTYEEIVELVGQPAMFTRQEKNPLEAYRWWFTGFNIKKERFVNEAVSDFFHVPAFKELIGNEQQIPLDQVDGLLANMQIQFVDYILTCK